MPRTANAPHRGMLLMLPIMREPLDREARLWAIHSSLHLCLLVCLLASLLACSVSVTVHTPGAQAGGVVARFVDPGYSWVCGMATLNRVCECGMRCTSRA
jgi:hypothetical protein